jgi:hypothetical protein
MPDERVVIKVQIGNLTIEVTGAPEYAEKKVDELIQKYTSSKAVEAGLVSKSVNPELTAKNLSPSEFIKKIGTKNQSERALVLGYYLEKVKGMENFTTADLIDISMQAKQSKFANIAATVSSLVQQGLLMGAGEKENKRAYTLTTTGEEQIDNLLSIGRDK